LYDRAVTYFQKIATQHEYEPALINQGNIFFLRNDYDSTLSHYQRVLNKNARNKAALLGVSRCNHELENYRLVGKTYNQLKEIDPELAMRFAYLDFQGEELTRAADAAGLKDMVLWEEDTNPTYKVTYDGNGATGGSVLVDNNTYEEGATVTILGNTGGLANIDGETEAYYFNGWNTQADGSGTGYVVDDTFHHGLLQCYLICSLNTLCYCINRSGRRSAVLR